jgi:hypothetical protein
MDDKYLALDSHVIVYDLVGFSSKDQDEQWEEVKTLTKKVKELLEVLFAVKRLEENQMWYAPAGDGGVIIFTKHCGGGSAAWLFARELAQRADPNLAIRLGISYGRVVIVESAPPVGPAILEADRLSSYPKSRQICVSRFFWDKRGDDETRGWGAKPSRLDPAALLLNQTKPIQWNRWILATAPLILLVLSVLFDFPRFDQSLIHGDSRARASLDFHGTEFA